jgi:hypothetical protein
MIARATFGQDIEQGIRIDDADATHCVFATPEEAIRQHAGSRANDNDISIVVKCQDVERINTRFDNIARR